MSKIEEFFRKVVADITLQAKFLEITANAEKAGEDATNRKLSEFAKDVGYDITFEEMKEFFREMAEKEDGTLSDSELDTVAGGGFFDYGKLLSKAITQTRFALIQEVRRKIIDFDKLVE